MHRKIDIAFWSAYKNGLNIKMRANVNTVCLVFIPQENISLISDVYIAGEGWSMLNFKLKTFS